MMQTADVGDRSDPALSCDWSCQRSIFVQRQVSSGTIVIVGIGSQHVAHMRHAENDQMVQTFPSDRSDQPFDIGVLPGRAWRRGTIPDAHGSDPSLEHPPISAIAISDEVSGRCVPRKGFRDLAGDPLRRRIGVDSYMNQLAPFMAYDEQPE